MVGVISCAAGCPDVTAGLGQNVYQGVYTPQSNGAGSSYQNVSLVLPSFFNGPAQISVLRVALSGVCIALFSWRVSIAERRC